MKQIDKLYNSRYDLRNIVHDVFHHHDRKIITNFALSRWAVIIQTSRFALVPSHIVSAITGYPTTEPNVMVMFKNNCDPFIMFSDGADVTTVNLALVSDTLLERICSELFVGMIPASVLPNTKEERKRNALIDALEHYPTSSDFFIA